MARASRMNGGRGAMAATYWQLVSRRSFEDCFGGVGFGVWGNRVGSRGEWICSGGGEARPRVNEDRKRVDNDATRLKFTTAREVGEPQARVPTVGD